MTTISLRSLPVRWRLGGLLVSLLSLAASGCASATYHVNDLPPQYVARPIDRLDKADLSRLTTYAVRSDQVGPGDLLEITVFSGYGTAKTEPNFVNVTEDGTADIPLIGPVRIGGMTLDGATQAIGAAARERDVFRTPHVSVKMAVQRTNRIAVSGAVVKPGVYEIPRGSCTLLGAILEAGGLSETASPDVTIRRPALSSAVPDANRENPLRLADGSDGTVLASYEEGLAEQARSWRVDLVSATEDGKGGYYLDDGDVVHVKDRPERKVRIAGLVNKSGEYEMPPNEDIYLLDALALAGGRSMQLADSVVVVRRVSDLEEPIRIKVSVREAQQQGMANIRLQENDMVIVEETPLTVAMEALKSFFRISIGSSLALF